MVRDGTAFKAAATFLLPIKVLALVIVMLLQPGFASAALRATHFEMKTAADGTTVSLRLTEKADIHWFQLDNPYRLVIDMPRTAFALEKPDLKPSGLVAAVRYGDSGPGRSRLILSASKPFSVKGVDIGAETDGHKLVVALREVSEAAFREAIQGQVATTASIAPAVAPPPSAGKPFTIVIDAGHGGFDGGAEGRNGTIEKDVTLTFARELEARLKSGKGGYQVLMTRSGDVFLGLDDRVEFARRHMADLFISIHADTIRFRGLRGATVYTGSETASDADSEALAERENSSDQLPGMTSIEDNPEVNDILQEFVRRETQSFSTVAAGHFVKHLAKTIGVINNPHRHARFRVLRAPDVPSVLIELGYLSNAQDERSLTSPAWRKRAVGAVGAAVDGFASERGGAVAKAGD